ncbi:signal peptidase I [Corynebacterium guangdongense]|uniref:Signal peptidase I n=1 Tax=Corynebacterium guangdongense TaxID=1783348 RepID=A0ABU1ZYZ3_9CORY|nr:signal peptidase I [Corynebacterium guangdongense]MDR7329608.1 signal peptidase I [Corynebacterium guangdongense]WJZ18173.1 Signal peptidase I [Corynebacterium guangdongense]
MTTSAFQNPRRGPRDRRRRTGETGRPWYRDYLYSVLWAFVLLAVFYALIGRLYVIPSGSMEPTLHGCEGCTGDRIFVEKVSYRFSDPEPGDVVVYEGTESWNTAYTSNRSENVAVRTMQNLGSYFGIVAPDENNLVKRVIATGGQTVSCQEDDPAVMVDGAPIDQSYTLAPAEYQINPATGSEACGGDYFGPITVPANSYWLMGDNRTNSMDSRYHVGDPHQGAIPEENIRGKVRWIVLPFSRVGGVDDPDIQPQQS